MRPPSFIAACSTMAREKEDVVRPIPQNVVDRKSVVIPDSDGYYNFEQGEL